MMEPTTARKAKYLVPWACVAGGFAVWIAALAVMAALPTEHAMAWRVGEPTGLLVLHQDPRSLQTVPVREVRPL